MLCEEDTMPVTTRMEWMKRAMRELLAGGIAVAFVVIQGIVDAFKGQRPTK